MSTAAKLEMAMEFYNKGILCKCTYWAETEEDEMGESEYILIHTDDCKGKDELKKLLEVQ